MVSFKVFSLYKTYQLSSEAYSSCKIYECDIKIYMILLWFYFTGIYAFDCRTTCCLSNLYGSIKCVLVACQIISVIYLSCMIYEYDINIYFISLLGCNITVFVCILHYMYVNIITNKAYGFARCVGFDNFRMYVRAFHCINHKYFHLSLASLVFTVLIEDGLILGWVWYVSTTLVMFIVFMKELWSYWHCGNTKQEIQAVSHCSVGIYTDGYWR